jgi:hypothetical protein
MVNSISFIRKKANLHFVSVYCQIALSTAVSMRISLSLSRFVTLSFSFSLSFSIGLWLPFLLLTRLKKKTEEICHTTTYLIVSNKKNSMFWNARRKLGKINIDTLQFRSMWRYILRESFWHIYIKKKRERHTHSLD